MIETDLDQLPSSSGDLAQTVLRWIELWQDAMNQREFTRAAEIVIAAIRRHIIGTEEWRSLGAARFHRDLRVVLNGLRDLSNLCHVVAEDAWLETPHMVERAWDLLHDAEDRLNYSGLELEFRESCLHLVDQAREAIQARFGAGLYTSWEVAFDWAECTVCKLDIRACEHLPGQWYDDQICSIHPIGLRPLAVALVENPRDPRCRIWPWNKREKGPDESGIIVECPIYIIFDPEGPEDGGMVVDLDDLRG
jgi:hypothetical protein